MPRPPQPARAPFELTRRRVLHCAAVATLGLAGLAPPRSAQASSRAPRLRLIGEARLPHRLQFQGTTVGGLSGIDYDEVSGLYYLLSDDGSAIQPARFYTARLPLDAQRLGEPTLTGTTALRQADGSTYPAALRGIQVPDPEAIRWRPAAADSSKFNRPAMVELATLSQINRLFTDQPPPEPFPALLAEAGVSCDIAPP